MFEKRLNNTNKLIDFIQMFNVLTASFWEFLKDEAEKNLEEHTNNELHWGADVKENLRNYERKLTLALEEEPLLIEKNNIVYTTTALGRSREGAENAIIDYILEIEKTKSEFKKDILKYIVSYYLDILNTLLDATRLLYKDIGCEDYLRMEYFSDLNLSFLTQKAKTLKNRRKDAFKKLNL